MQEITNKLPNIFDVAKRAGVSRGTVDRVIFGRGRVSPQTREKVLKAISELNYTPNSNASKLASKREYRLACLIPQFNKGDYWEAMYNGFIAATKDYSSYNLNLAVYNYDQMSVDSFLDESVKILESKPAGVIMNAVFREEVIQFANQLEHEGIPYAFVDNKIDELDYTLYYGVDPYKSGALGAYLLTTRMDVKEIALVRLQRDLKHKADPNRPRRHGFTDYIEDNCPDCRIRTVFIDPEDENGTMAALESFFSEHPHIHHIAMTNSRVFLLGNYLVLYLSDVLCYLCKVIIKLVKIRLKFLLLILESLFLKLGRFLHLLGSFFELLGILDLLGSTFDRCGYLYG